MTKRKLAAIGLISVIPSCRSDEIQCPMWILPAVAVEIRDAHNGLAIAAEARGVVRDGAYVDSLRPYEQLGHDLSGLYSRAAADERPGTYSVEVTHAGYRTWTTSGVTAKPGRCNVQTKRVHANMEPAG